MGKAGDYRICPKCGKDIKVDATLCGYCWTKSPPSSRAAAIQAAHEREFEMLVEELSRIGRDVRVIRYPGGRKEQVGASGFLRSGDGGEVNERAGVIGRRLAVIGGHDLMLRAHRELQSILGAEVAHELSEAWQGIGYWGRHDQTYQRPLPVPKAKSQNLRALEERLSCDLSFAKVTVQRDGANLNHWIPPLSKEEIRAAVEAAQYVCQPSSDEESQVQVQDSDKLALSEESRHGELSMAPKTDSIFILFDKPAPEVDLKRMLRGLSSAIQEKYGNAEQINYSHSEDPSIVCVRVVYPFGFFSSATKINDLKNFALKTWNGLLKGCSSQSQKKRSWAFWRR